MPYGRAESLESLARYTRLYRGYVVLDSKHDVVREAKGPVRRETLRPWGPRSNGRDIDDFKAPWEGRRPLRLTISAKAFAQNPTGCEELAALSALDSIDVDVSEDVPSGSLPSAGDISIRHLGGDHWELRTSRRESTTYGLFLQPSFLQVISGDIERHDGGSACEARQTALDAEAHDALQNDLFVTTSEYLLSRRFSTRGWPGSIGVVTPSEAFTLVNALLRSRGEFVTFHSPTARTTLGSTLFYAAVARALMPTATAALRFCLNPNERARLRPVADHLLGIFDRVHDLAVAADHLAVLAQLEGHLGGGNTLLAQQMYHFQNSLVLVTGALDVLVWVIVALDGQQPKKFDVAWGKRKEVSGWRQRVTDADAAALLEASRRESKDDELLTLAISLRDTYQHRHPVAGGLCEFHNHDGLAQACLGVVDLSTSVGAAPSGRSEAVGVLPAGDLDLVLPASFQRGLLRAVTRTVERVLGATAWPADEWWVPARGEGVVWLEPESELLRAFGIS